MVMLRIRWYRYLIVALVLTVSKGIVESGVHSSVSDGLAMSFGYQAVHPFASYPGGSVILGVGVQNTGIVQERIVEMSISVDFAGLLPTPAQIPLLLQPGERREFDVLVHVPSTARVGDHLAEASVSYEYLDPTTQQWVHSAYSPRIMASHVPLYQSPSQKFRDGFTILGGIGLMSGILPLLAWKRKISFTFVGKGLGLVGGTFGLLVSSLMLILSERPDLLARTFSATLFAGSLLGIAGKYLPRPNTAGKGLAMLGGALSILLAWWYGFWLPATSLEDGGAQLFLSSTYLFFSWVSLLIVGSLMMIIDRDKTPKPWWGG